MYHIFGVQLYVIETENWVKYSSAISEKESLAF